MRTAEKFQNRAKKLSSAPASFRISALPINDEFLIENSNKILYYLYNILSVSSTIRTVTIVFSLLAQHSDCTQVFSYLPDKVKKNLIQNSRITPD